MHQKILLYAILMGIYLLSNGRPTDDAPPPPTPSTTQLSESGVILDGSIEHTDPNFEYWVETAGSNINCFQVIGESYIVFDRTFRVSPKYLTGSRLFVYISLRDAYGNDVLGNFMGQSDSHFSGFIELNSTFATNLDISLDCQSGLPPSPLNCDIDIRILLTCNVPATYPAERDVFVHIDFDGGAITTNPLGIGTGNAGGGSQTSGPTFLPTDNHYEIRLTACPPLNPNSGLEPMRPVGKTTFGSRVGKVNTFESEFEFGPNPFFNYLSIQTHAHVEEQLQFKLYSLQAALLRKSEWVSGGGKLRWDLAGLPSGIYFLEIRNAKGELGYRKLIK